LTWLEGHNYYQVTLADRYASADLFVAPFQSIFLNISNGQNHLFVGATKPSFPRILSRELVGQNWTGA